MRGAGRFRLTKCTVLLMMVIGAIVVLTSTSATPARASVPPGPPVFSNPLDITNTYQPFKAGALKVFKGRKEGKASVIVDIYLDDTRTFDFGGGDVECHIVQETEFEGGQLGEVSTNYFAQGDDGAVYYFGEVVDEYENGVIIAHEGSWLVGGPTLPSDPVDTANASEPGLFMPANPQVGDAFKPENLFPVVDETVTVIATGKRVVVPAGKFLNSIKVRETSQLPGPAEIKYYSPGVGVVRGTTKHESFALVATSLRP